MTQTNFEIYKVKHPCETDKKKIQEHPICDRHTHTIQKDRIVNQSLYYFHFQEKKLLQLYIWFS